MGALKGGGDGDDADDDDADEAADCARKSVDAPVGMGEQYCGQYPAKVEALTRCWFCRTNKEVPCELHDRQEAWGAAGAHRDEAVMRKCAEPSGRCGHQKQSEVNLGGFSGIPLD